jgi:DNA-binding NarL/FixJ family response regulator
MPLTILVVEDDLATRVSITDYLELSGYSAIPAVNGRDALARLDRHQPHLLITDAIMPEMDGYELVRQIRQQPNFRLLPVIFLTARNETRDRIRGYQAGIDLHMPKPFELDELAAVVRNFLDRYTMMSHASAVAAPAPAPVPDSRDVNIDLTDREQEVLDLLSQGLSNNQIGDRLYLSSRTIEKYVSNLLRKTDTSNRSVLVRFAIEHHLLQG